MMGGMAPLDAYPRAREAARRALTLDATLADAHLAAGHACSSGSTGDRRTPRDRSNARSRSTPSHAAAHHDYAWALVAPRPRRRGDRAHHDGARSRSAVDARQHRHRLALPAPAAARPRRRARVSTRSRFNRTRSRRRPVSSAPTCSAACTTPRCARRSRRFRRHGCRRARQRRGCRLAIACCAFWRWRLQRLEAASRTRWISPYTLAVAPGHARRNRSRARAARARLRPARRA